MQHNFHYVAEEEKMKDILSSIAIGVMVGIIIFEVIFAIGLFRDPNGDGSIQVEVEDGEASVVEFEKLGLLPGQSVEYTLYLSSSDGPTKTVHFDFHETADSPLADYVYVKMLFEGEEICDALLADVMTDLPIAFETDLSSGDQREVTVIYYMPEEVGNEAEGAEAWFDLYITAQFH